MNIKSIQDLLESQVGVDVKGLLSDIINFETEDFAYTIKNYKNHGFSLLFAGGFFKFTSCDVVVDWRICRSLLRLKNHRGETVGCISLGKKSRNQLDCKSK